MPTKATLTRASAISLALAGLLLLFASAASAGPARRDPTRHHVRHHRRHHVRHHRRHHVRHGRTASRRPIKASLVHKIMLYTPMLQSHYMPPDKTHPGPPH